MTCFNDLRVLVVDDHPTNRLVMTEVFTHLGCVVSVAEDGAQALSQSSVDHFDLICLDRHMPGPSGDEVVALLPADQFVLAWSTELSDLPERFNGTLSKPVIIAAAQTALAKAGACRLLSRSCSQRVRPRSWVAQTTIFGGKGLWGKPCMGNSLSRFAKPPRQLPPSSPPTTELFNLRGEIEAVSLAQEWRGDQKLVPPQWLGEVS
jgi:CheY-like chemotaxis protein